MTTVAGVPQGAENSLALKQACEEFAAVFWGEVLKAMRRTVPKGGLFTGGAGEEIFRGFLDAEYARKVAQSEASLAQMLYRQFQLLPRA